MTEFGRRSRTAIVGASGYTGAELLRILVCHPKIEVLSLIGDRNAGKSIQEVFPAFRHLDLPRLEKLSDFNLNRVDLVFCALPHGTSQEVIAGIADSVRVVDLSADFRIRDPKEYERWYGNVHIAPNLQRSAVYGLTEYYREQIAAARLVACTGCNSATGLYALLPLVGSGTIELDDIIIDLKTGVSGAGRSAKIGMLHAEISEGTQAYSVSWHRHLAEFDQELSLAAGQEVRVSFTPHLVPQNRGILATIYVKGNPEEIYATLVARYEDEEFVRVLPFGECPSTRHVRGSNYVHIGVERDRIAGRAKVLSALDNLTKGSSGQAVQNANLMLGHDEGDGLASIGFFP